MSGQSGAGHAKKILAVDDDFHTRTLLVDLCESAGFEVFQATDGEEALAAVAKHQPDLVLLDLDIPRRDGFSVLKTLRESEAHAQLPIILLTAMGDMGGKLRGMELGADDYVTKPFKLVELQTRINSALIVRDYRRRLVEAEEELSKLRALDPATGAGTYAQLKASLDAELSRSRRYGRPASVLVFGFDDYPALRETLGRDGCDRFMGRLVEELRGGLRGADRVFRLANDEFVIVLPETDPAGALIAAKRLLSITVRTTAETPSGPLAVPVRFGGATFPSESVRNSEDLLREAARSLRELLEAGGEQRIFG
ncbi:MAG: response regulator [Myxococcaceae bacterium]|nr:response regulator [Myxococcaceae bacterium]